MAASDITTRCDVQAEWLMSLVVDADTEGMLQATDPGELVQMLGAVASLIRFAAMFEAAIADRLTQIAQEAAGG